MIILPRYKEKSLSVLYRYCHIRFHCIWWCPIFFDNQVLSQHHHSPVEKSTGVPSERQDISGRPTNYTCMTFNLRKVKLFLYTRYTGICILFLITESNWLCTDKKSKFHTWKKENNICTQFWAFRPRRFPVWMSVTLCHFKQIFYIWNGFKKYFDQYIHHKCTYWFYRNITSAHLYHHSRIFDCEL